MTETGSEAVPSSRDIDWASLATMAHVVFLLDADDDFEFDLLKRRIASGKPAAVGTRVDYRRLDDDDIVATGNDTPAEFVWMQPLRIAWLPAAVDRSAGLLRNLLLGRLSEPGRIRRRLIARSNPERIAWIVAEGASLADLEARFERIDGTAVRSLEAFVAREAIVALERAERNARGSRYKIARLLPRDVFSDGRFQESLANIAQQRDKDIVDVRATANRYLREMAAMQTPFTVDVMTSLYRAVCSASHERDIDCPDAQIAQLRELVAERPIAFLITHKSMLDTAAFSLVMFDANLPIPLTFGGINLQTPGAGVLLRRAGIIFLRRSFQDNAIYKTTFRRYIDYLIEKRFSLLWALEGTRSRTGKLLPPRFGLFNYVVESILRTGLTHVAFVPVTVTYDQITEVEDYATEQRGRSKKPEGIGWMFRFFKRNRSHGRIYVRFGESLTVEDIATGVRLDETIGNAEKQILVRTLAFEVAVRMNAASPITAASIITLILLAGGSRALSFAELQGLARAGAALIRRQGGSRLSEMQTSRTTIHSARTSIHCMLPESSAISTRASSACTASNRSNITRQPTIATRRFTTSSSTH